MIKLRKYTKLSSNENFTNSDNNDIKLQNLNFFKAYFHKEKYIKIYISIILILILIIFLIFLIVIFLNFSKKVHKNIEKETGKKVIKIINIGVNKTFDFENRIFGLVTRKDCSPCGLFSYYSIHLGCILKYLSDGYIPIIDVGSFENVFNSFKENSSSNPWELLFNQPFGYTLEEVKKNAKNITNLPCSWTNMAPSEIEIYKSQLNINFHREMARKYMSVKKEIMDQANILWAKLFNKSKNVLGVLGRGTDFVQINPSGHSIPPSTDKMIEDVKKMNQKNKYDWIYLATEDDNIKQKFLEEFGQKIKMVQNTSINYQGGYIGENKNVQGIEFQKINLISMITLSKCIDVIISRCSGAMGAFIFSEGFRESIVYFLGQY